MYVSNDEQALEIFKWGNRLLYLALFVFIIVSISYWNYPTTLPYLGAILSLFYLNRIWERYGKEKECCVWCGDPATEETTEGSMCFGCMRDGVKAGWIEEREVAETIQEPI